MSTSNARFSTYSGAPSLQPSLAPTFETNTNSARDSHSTTTYLHPEKASGREMYSSADGALASTSTLNSSDPKTADIKSWSGALERMQDERLDKQRYVMSGNKSDDVSATALGAKVERALSRRMSGQDATFKPAKKAIDSEKRSREVEAR